MLALVNHLFKIYFKVIDGLACLCTCMLVVVIEFLFHMHVKSDTQANVEHI